MLSKFLNTKTLIILLLVLGGIYLVTKLTEKEDRTFKSELVAIDTSLVSKIVVIPKIGSGPKVTLTQTGTEWSVASDGKTYKSDLGTVQNILAELTRMRTLRVAAIDESKWKEQQVTDSTATRIQLWNNDEVLADLYLGKFSYQQAQDPQNPYGQQQTRMFTHIRPVNDDIVYVVEGFIKMTIQSKVDHYRAKTLAAIDRLDITKVTFDYPGNEDFTITRENNTWLVNGMPCDTNETNRYLMKFKRLTASAFLSDTDEISATPSHTVKFEGNNIFPVELKAYPAADTNLRYGIRTNLVSDAIYNGGKNKLFEKIYIDPADLMPKEK